MLKLEIDLGIETRTLMAGIAGTYKPEDLVGKKIVVVANLEPKKLMGVESHGMVLAAGDGEGGVRVLFPDGDPPPGAKVS
jgi:methionyl-tRNA synthetase